MEIKAGTRLRSAVSPAEVIVVRAPSGDVDLRSGGTPMLPQADTSPAGTPAAELGDELLMGKRYWHEGVGLEVLITKAGAGTLTIGDEPLERKDAKALPASD